MAFRVRKQYNTYTARQRVSLENGNIPGRKAKQYRVSYYDFSNKPHRRTQSFWDGRVDRVEISREGLDVQRIGETTDYLWTPTLDPADSAAAMSQIHSKAQKAREDGLNAAVFISELPSTMKMFAGTASKVLKAWKAAVRGDLTAAAHLLGVRRRAKRGSAAANNWLELKYGWLPLLSDIDSGARKLAKVLHDPNRTWTVTGHVNRKTTSEQVLPSGDSLTPDGRLYTTLEAGCKASVSFGVGSEFISHAASLGFTNPMLIAWETLPLSFTVDWLFSVGDWLSSFSTFHGMSFVDGYLTIFGKSESTYAYRGYETQDYRYKTVMNPDGSETVEVLHNSTISMTGSVIVVKASGFKRDPMLDFPGPITPRLDVNFSIAKVVTSLALARQRV